MSSRGTDNIIGISVCDASSAIIGLTLLAGGFVLIGLTPMTFTAFAQGENNTNYTAGVTTSSDTSTTTSSS
jgi:hypothetical protein